MRVPLGEDVAASLCWECNEERIGWGVEACEDWPELKEELLLQPR